MGETSTVNRQSSIRPTPGPLHDVERGTRLSGPIAKAPSDGFSHRTVCPREAFLSGSAARKVFRSFGKVFRSIETTFRGLKTAL
jgi:hypothetical protein